MERHQVSRLLDVTRHPELLMTRNLFSREQIPKTPGLIVE